MKDKLPRTLPGAEVMLAVIYDVHDRQYYPSINELVLKFVWALGEFTSVNRKESADKAPVFLADLFAWWIAICNFLSFKVEEVLWYKFPGICPYCGAEKDCDCEGRKDLVRISEDLVKSHRDNGTPPRTIADWQAMYDRIYGKANALKGYDFAVARLPEEIKEMIECILPWIKDRDELKLELADIGARIFALANLMKFSLQEVFLSRYPGRCPTCHLPKCGCNPMEGAPA
jgi:NTP pyrophosphatase (non-canonical NTP hydrolase)